MSDTKGFGLHFPFLSSRLGGQSGTGEVGQWGNILGVPLGTFFFLMLFFLTLVVESHQRALRLLSGVWDHSKNGGKAQIQSVH